LFLLWKEGGGKNEIDVMPSKVIGLSQVLELFNIRIRVSGERAKALFYLREVSKGKGDMDPRNAFHSVHFLERVWKLADWGSVRASVCGAHGILWFWVGRRMGGRRGGRKSGGRRLNNGSLSLIRWRLISRVERRENFRVSRGFRKGFDLF
jgi:hypothetical protein